MRQIGFKSELEEVVNLDEEDLPPCLQEFSVLKLKGCTLIRQGINQVCICRAEHWKMLIEIGAMELALKEVDDE